MYVSLAEIEVGERRREDYGDLSGLAASLRRYGLIHPIVVDSEKRLVVGGRRLEAARILGWNEIEARDYGELTDEELREIELEENLRRKDLTPYEQARELVRKAEQIAPAISDKLSEKAPQGRKSTYGAPKEDIAQALGKSDFSIRQAEQHVAIAEEIPELQGPDWKQSYVLAFKENLEKLPEKDREAAKAMAGEEFVIPKKAVKILENLADKTAAEREKIFALHQSGDERKHSAAMSMAATGKVFPDLRAASLKTVIDELKGCIRMFPEDVLVPRFQAVIDELASLKSEVERLHEEKILGQLPG